MVSSIVVGPAKECGQLQCNWAMSLVVVLSQDNTFMQGKLVRTITDLKMQRQIKDHIAQMAHVVKRILHDHEWNKLLSEKGNQGGATIMGLS